MSRQPAPRSTLSGLWTHLRLAPSPTPRGPSGTSRSKLDLLSALCSLVCATVLTAFFFGLWNFRWRVPYEYTDDALQKMLWVKTIWDHGSLFSNPALSAPFEYSAYNFPRIDSLNYLILKMPQPFAHDWVVALNAYFFSSFVAAALTMTILLRRGLNISPLLSVVGALLYAFLPYHALRGLSHFTNAAYFLVPLAVLVLLWTLRGRLVTHGWRERRFIAAVVVAILVPLQNPYYGFFFAILMCAALVVRQLRRPRRHQAVASLAVLAATALSFAAEQLPRQMLVWQHEHNTAVALRLPSETNSFSLSLAHLFLPNDRHRIDLLRAVKERYNRTFEQPVPPLPEEKLSLHRYNERTMASLGFVGSIGCALLLLAPFVSHPAGRHRTPLVLLHELTLLNAVALIYAIADGAGTPFSFFVITSVRATNRIFPYVACFALAAVCVMAGAASARIRRGWFVAAVLVIGSLGVLDETSPLMLPDRKAIAAAFKGDARYMRAIEARAPTGAMVFELPFVSYPENGPTHRVLDYSLLKPYLHSTRLRFSYPAMRGRAAAYWNEEVASLPATDMLSTLRRAGFSAILIDSFAQGQEDTTRQVVALSTALQQAPTVSADGRYQTFLFEPSTSPDTALLRYRWGEVLSFAASGHPRRCFVLGWAAPEPWGTRTIGPHAIVRIPLEAPAPSDLTLQVHLQGHRDAGELTRRMRMRVNGTEVGGWSLEGSGWEWRELAIPARLVRERRELVVQFDVDASRSPRQDGESTNGERPAIGVAALILAPAVPTP